MDGSRWNGKFLFRFIHFKRKLMSWLFMMLSRLSLAQCPVMLNGLRR